MRGSAIAAAVALAAPIIAGTSATALAEIPPVRTGEEIYNSSCIYCHDRRGWGTRVLARRVPEGQAALTDRENLPAAFTALVVRQGVGSMPPFTPTDLSDEEIAAVAQWLESGG